MQSKVQIHIAGVMSEEYIMCCKCAETIKEKYPAQIGGFDAQCMQQTQWNHHLEKLANNHKGDFYNHTQNHIVYINDNEFIGDAARFLEWALRNFRYVDDTNSMEYFKQAYTSFNQGINETAGRSYVFLQVLGEFDQMKNEVHEMVVCELFDDLCPKTCKNFRSLCEGFERDSKKLTYCDTEFDRIVPGAFVQGGNLRKTALGADLASYSSFDEGEFADENFSVKHTEPGLLGMCKRNDYANSNECQFYVTLGAPLSYMDNKNVVFGRIINGMKTFRSIEKLETYNQKPTSKVIIRKGGAYTGY